MNAKNNFKIATLNVRGINERVQKDIIALDAYNYKVQIIAITETHIGRAQRATI